MRKMGIGIALVCLCAVSALGEVPDAGPDSFGIYFDVGGEFTNEINDVFPNTFIPTFVILSGITRPSIGGWEVAFDFTPATGSVISTTFLGDAANFLTPPSFIVGLGSPVPVPSDGHLVLAEMNWLYFSGIVEWHGGPADPSSIPGVPAYSNGEDVNDIVPCHFSTDQDGSFLDDLGRTTIPLATVNGEAPVAAEALDWGSVKALYR